MWETKLSQALRARPNLPEFNSKQVAATLLLLSPTNGGKSFDIILTKRTNKVDSHKGQISLPGGFRESEDLNWEATALRESFEEIGVPQHLVRILGGLEPVMTGNRVSIIPIVGLQTASISYKINPEEVEKILFLPADELLRQGLKPVVALEGPYSIQSVGLHWENELIWGATARILEQLYEILVQP